MFLSGGASTILEIVPDGTMVKKGDVLCTLDASEYEEVANVQTIRVLQHHAEMVQTELQLQSAEIALKEYQDGLLPQDTLAITGQIALGESEVHAASERLAWSERMLTDGYVSRAQVANDRQALLSATLRLRKAKTELETYRRFNSPKTLTALRAAVEKARAWAIHEAGDYDKSKAQLALYRSLIERCTIRAPHDGFVIYANAAFREEEDRLRIEQGASVIQGQELFYFPDLNKMEVVAMLHQTVVGRVSKGMRARVRIEGSEAGDCEGHVESLDGLPKWSYNDVRYYPCRIALSTIPPGLLPGKSAEVEIVVGRCNDVLAVPIEFVNLDRGRHICYVIGRSGLERREITCGASTPGLIEIAGGLKDGECVVVDPTRTSAGAARQPDSVSPDPTEAAARAALR
jgi:HlyD family secretion protein